MKKRIFAAFLALTLCLGLQPAMALETGSDFVIDKNGVLTDYTGPGGDVVVPDGVTAIGVGAFNAQFDLTSLTIPEGVTEIGRSAFSSCMSLTRIVLPDSVAKIGDSAFRNCETLVSVVLPASATEIGEYLFWGCKSLSSVVIPEGVTKIDSYAFSYCSSLTTVSIPKSVTSIGVDVFEDTPWLKHQGEFPVVNGILLAYQGEGGNVVIPPNVTKINPFAFYFDRSLTGVSIPNGVTEIGGSAFQGCGSLISVTIPNSVTEIGTAAFCDCGSLTSVMIPASVTSIGLSAFEGCSSLTSVAIPSGVTEISSSTFSGCTGLTSVIIPDSVASIGRSAFSGCTSLTSVTIPDSVAGIDSYAFSGCVGLTGVTIPDSLTRIGSGAFSGCTGLAAVSIPESVTEIGSRAFENTPWQKRQGDFPAFHGILLEYQGEDGVAVIPEGITRINDGAFSGCNGLTHVIIPASVTGIGEYAFSYCEGLTNVTIPDGVTEIGGGAFYMCENLASVNIPGSVTRIGRDAFMCAMGIGDGGAVYYAPNNLTIYGETGSRAEAYAKEGEIPFVVGKALAFSDVPGWCATEAEWAAAKGIAKGTGDGEFSPGAACTVREILTFLYRANGEPETAAANPFTDVESDAWYTDAAIWAAERGLVPGSGTIGAKDGCTRGTVVTFLWKLAGSPEMDYHGGFVDVTPDMDCAQAVEWAEANGLTNGVGDGRFDPRSVCMRGEIVTFLYRAYSN